jgi:outer membrane protein TolC
MPVLICAGIVFVVMSCPALGQVTEEVTEAALEEKEMATTQPGGGGLDVDVIRIRTSPVAEDRNSLPAEAAWPHPVWLPAPTGERIDMTIGEVLAHHLADPSDERVTAAKLRDEAPKNQDGELNSEGKYHQQIITYVDRIRRSDQMKISLQEAIARMLLNNYAIKVSGFDPAISATEIVEAEAAFDATYFLNITNDKGDVPSPSPELSGTNTEAFNLTTGFAKLLPTGLQATTYYSWTRRASDSIFQALNPAHFNQLVFELRQPLLRGFGIDFNRTQINTSKNNRLITVQQFKAEVRDRLRDVEQAYWFLLQARRNVTVTARLLSSFEQIYDFLKMRGEYDAYAVQLALTASRVEAIKSQFYEIINRVYDTEDQLKALMNDPDIPLSRSIELIPTNMPIQDGIIVDPIGEVQTALEHREELKQAELQVENARIFLGAAKNQLMPRFDLTFRYTVDGLGGHADDAFDDVTRHDFTEYFVGVEFEYPLGNRAAESRHKRARHQLSKAEAAVQQVLEAIILEVNVAVRDLQTQYNRMLPSYLSVVAAEDDVKARIARQEKKDPLTLEAELGARQSLAGSRAELLQVMVGYSTSITNLEGAKGTLLDYNNVVLSEDDNGLPQFGQN